jgi:hypothetical protein
MHRLLDQLTAQTDQNSLGAAPRVCLESSVQGALGDPNRLRELGN